MKKLPIIGLIIGAIAAGFAFMKHKKSGDTAAEIPPQDTNPPA